MIRKTLAFLIMAFALCWTAQSQELSQSMSQLMQICVDLSHGLYNYSDQNLSDANEAFRQFRMKNPIGALPASNVNPAQESTVTEENVVFLPEFFDRIIENDQAYEMSVTLKKRFERNFGNQKVVKGSKRKYDIYQKDFFVSPGEIITFDIDCQDPVFEVFAVSSSPQGLFNMSVYDYGRKEYWNDEEKETSGDEKRFRHIEGKKNGKYRVTLENRVKGSYTIAVFCNL